MGNHLPEGFAQKHKTTPGETQKLLLKARSCNPERGENYLEGAKVNIVSNGMGREEKGRYDYKEQKCFICDFGQFVVIISLLSPEKTNIV